MTLTLLQQSIEEVGKKLAAQELSVEELVAESLDRIEQVDGRIGAFLSVTGEDARKEAQKLDRKLREGGERGLLFGLPAGIKDNMNTLGYKTTCASQFLSNYTSIYDATAVQNLQRHEYVLVGKTNMDEFAMGGSNENSSFHPVRNPWNLDYVPGGSSGGSAAAVAAGEVYFALGSDTGGSIRQPASYCGIVGLKPTYGLVSRFGLVAFASSLDQIGPLTKNVEDSAYVLQAIAGHDSKDSTSLKVDLPDYRKALTGDIRGLRVAVPKEYMGEGVAPAVRDAVRNALAELEKLGAVWEEVSLPHTEYAVAAYYLLASSEASSNLARFDGVRYGVRAEQADNLLDLYRKSRSEGFGPEVKRRIMLGTYALSSGYYEAYYLKAQKVRTLIKRDFDEVFERFDIIVGPTAPTPAFKLGEQASDPLTMYLNDILTIPVSLAGIPAISVPCGMADGLPIGLQIIGKALDESTILRAAHAFEQHTDYHLARPAL
ncbi:Asp-tRNA(Asn)/Glu-tRNA(Gln) amidotransferase subunit GatA [Gorillibacterium timonense]|uniref:Asp-tRNA(Asn)/Glu-tRNA(Gln) amidotransferase subunit GatA n=1 Tax=Gorillibacterium timonense TaxID=1689269 RepID=UPI003709BA78